jgi:integrase
VSERPTAEQLLGRPHAVLTRSHLRELGLERRAVDAVFHECPIIQLPGYSRPLVRVSDYLALLEGSTYCDRCGDKVRPTRVGQSERLRPSGRRDGAAGTATAPTATDTAGGADRAHNRNPHALMPSVWIKTRRTASGSRYRVEFRLGGRAARVHYAGSFKTKREATIRRNWLAGELAARRVPKLAPLEEPQRAPTFSEASARWRASRLDLAASTREQHRIQLDKLLALIGRRAIDTLTAQDFIDVVARLHAQGVARETIRKTLGAGAMTLDHAGISPNPARDRSIKLPREEPEEISPPSAADVTAVFGRIPAKHRLALIWLDWSGARVSSVDHLRVGDYDESRRRVRLRAATTKTRRALWVELHPVLAEAVETTLPHRRFRDPEARLFAASGADALRTAIAKACKAEGIPLFSPHDLRHRRISLLHLRGVPWARIGEFVGQRDLTVTANTYTHVLVDEAEVDYLALLA